MIGRFTKLGWQLQTLGHYVCSVKIINANDQNLENEIMFTAHIKERDQ